MRKRRIKSAYVFWMGLIVTWLIFSGCNKCSLPDDKYVDAEPDRSMLQVLIARRDENGDYVKNLSIRYHVYSRSRIVESGNGENNRDLSIKYQVCSSPRIVESENRNLVMEMLDLYSSYLYSPVLIDDGRSVEGKRPVIPDEDSPIPTINIDPQDDNPGVMRTVTYSYSTTMNGNQVKQSTVFRIWLFDDYDLRIINPQDGRSFNKDYSRSHVRHKYSIEGWMGDVIHFDAASEIVFLYCGVLSLEDYHSKTQLIQKIDEIIKKASEETTK